jgi:hypothetical protein
MKPGDRIRLILMDDPDPVPPGTLGTVLDDKGHVFWDNCRSLSPIPGVDKYEIVGHMDLLPEDDGCPRCMNRAVDLLVWDESGETVTCSVCKTVYIP